TALDGLAHHVVAVHFPDVEADLAVVDQQRVARLGVVGEPLVSGGNPVVGPLHVIDGDAHHVPGAPLHRTGRELAQTDLRPLQVGEDAYGPAALLRRRPDHLVDLPVIFVTAVAEIQTGDVHSAADELGHLLGSCGGR